MPGTTRSLSILLAVVAGSVWLASRASADGGPGEFQAALVRCAAVSQPGPLTGCGTDPLRRGKAEIGPDGRVEVDVEGATASVSYTVVLRSIDGATQLTLGTLATNASGNGELHVTGALVPGTVGAGNVVLRRVDKDQFVTGFVVAPAETGRHDDGDENDGEDGDGRAFEAPLVRCAEVGVPAALGGCGTDPLLAGKAEIDEEGQVEVEIAGASPSATYAVVYRSLDGKVQLALGTLTTNAGGRGELKVTGVFLKGQVGAGTIVLRRLSLDQFVTGFDVPGPRPRSFESAIVACAAVDTPAALAHCGSDPLKAGKADIRLDGRVKVEIEGASPGTTYALVLRSPDGTTDEALGTLATNPAGNGELKIIGTFVPGDVGGGNLVLRRADADQFVSGFRIRGEHARGLEGALVRCHDVNRPGALTGCGTDPLLAGDVQIRPDGRVKLKVLGAAPSVTYDVVLVGVAGGTPLSLGTVTTNAAGQGALDAQGVFTDGAVGAGNVELRRAGHVQFVTGFQVQAIDVSDDHWAKPWVDALFSTGITGGCVNDPVLYCPDAEVTRAQMAVFLLRGEHGPNFTPGAATGRFSDVPTTHWAVGWIEQLASEGLTSGCGSGRYCPESSLTRAEMALFLLRAKHGNSYQPPAATGHVFDDVPAGYWAAAWIEQLSREGVTAGCGTRAFCPDAPVSRAEMAVFLVRAFGFAP